MIKRIVETSDGSHTIYVPGMDEHYHSIHGAVQESDFIFIKNGFELCKSDPVNIFEVGFGTGLNALLTAQKAAGGKREVYYTSIEKFPLEDEIVKALNHKMFSGRGNEALYDRIHSAEWNKMVNICPGFNLMKVRADLLATRLPGSYDLIYFDAFGPAKQPEMWTHDVLGYIASITRQGGIFVTYSARGEVRRTLTSAGFKVSLLPGPPGKRQMINAIKM